MFNVTAEKQNGILVLHAGGKISIGGGDAAMRQATESAVAEHERAIVLDLAAVTFVDSAGFGELVSVLTTCMVNRVMFAVATIPPKLDELFVITGVITVLPVFPTVDAAVDALSRISFEEYLTVSKQWTQAANLGGG